MTTSIYGNSPTAPTPLAPPVKGSISYGSPGRVR